MRKSFILFLAFASATLFSCKNNNNQADDFDGITIYAPLLDEEHTEHPALDYFVSSFDTIRLQSTVLESYFANVSDVKMTKDLIFIKSGDAVFIFDHQGAFVRKISKRGRGHGEYSRVSKFDIQEEKEQLSIFDSDQNQIYVYTFNGDFIKKIPVQNWCVDFAVLPNGNYLMMNLIDEREGVRGLWEMDDQGNTVKVLFRLPDYYQHISLNQQYLVHINDSVIGCQGLENTDLIYYFQNDSLMPIYKVNTDITIPREIMEKDGRWENPDKEYTKAGYWETDRFMGMSVLNFKNFLVLVYDKKEDRLFRYYDTELMAEGNDIPYVASFEYCYKQKGVQVINYGMVMQSEEVKAAFPEFTAESNPILIITNLTR